MDKPKVDNKYVLVGAGLLIGFSAGLSLMAWREFQQAQAPATFDPLLVAKPCGCKEDQDLIWSELAGIQERLAIRANPLNVTDDYGNLVNGKQE